MVHPSGVGGVQVAPCTVVNLAIAVHIGNLRAVAEDCTLTGADGHLGTTVAVEVGHGKARRVAEDDARSALHAPQQCAVELISVPDDRPETVFLRVAGARTVADDVAAGILHALKALHHNLELAVAVEVAHAHIVGRIDNLCRVSIHVLRVGQRDADIG